MTFSYSVVIRTLGNTGEKYRTMLHSISQQTIPPEEIIVAIPEGYPLDHTLGNERIVRCEKGMVTQRAVGIATAKSEYLLVLDDDLDFPADFAEQLYKASQEKDLDCVLAFGTYQPKGAEEINTSALPAALPIRQKLLNKMKHLRGAFTGQAFYSHRNADFFDVITRTAGHRTYLECEDKPVQTGAFACLFIKAEAANSVHFEEERWLEEGKLSSYAAYDDAVFYYKLYLHGGRIAYTHNTAFTHLDAAAGRPADDNLSAKKIRLYTIARNRTIFWYRHILPNRPEIATWIAGLYGLGNYALYSIIINLAPNNWPSIHALLMGYWDAISYIKNTK